MNRRLLSVVLLASSLASAHGALVLVAQNLPLDSEYPRYGATAGADQDPGGDPYQIVVGQTFLAQASGQLYSIEATVDMSAGYEPVHPLMVSVLSLVDGQPGAVLASASVSPTEFPPEYTGNWFSITAQFSDGLLLREGTQYAIEFSSLTAPAHYMVFGASTVTDYYSRGVAYSGDFIDPAHQGDFYFRVTANVPEPSTALLGVLGCLVLLQPRRRGF